MIICQGDIYWIDLGQPIGSEPGYLRPYVVIQNDVLNSSQIRTVIVCALTTNLRRAKAMGNVLLEAGEANLGDQSVVNVSQVLTVDKAFLVDKIGRVSQDRVRQILAGLALVTKPMEIDSVNKMSEIVVRSHFTPKHLPQYPQATTFSLFSILL